MIQRFAMLMALSTYLVVIGGCNSNTVSLKEAESITAEFKGSAFVPPPRAIDDLMARLKRPQIAATKNLADSCNGVERDSHWIRRFKEYLKHYQPSDRINTTEHPIGGWNFEYGWELYRGISIQEIRRGNLQRAEQAQRTYLNLIPDNRRGLRFPDTHISLSFRLAGVISAKVRPLLRHQNRWRVA